MARKEQIAFEKLVRAHNHACFAGIHDVTEKCLTDIADFLRANDPDTKFLDLTFSADAPEVAALIFTLHDKRIYQEGFKNKPNFPYSHFHFVSKERDRFFIAMLHAAGMPMQEFAFSFAHEAFLNDDAEYLSLCEVLHGKRFSIFEDIDSHTVIIPTCGPNLVDRVLEDLPDFEADYIARSYSSTKKMPLKVLSVWVLSGRNLSEWIHVLHPDHAWIAQLSSSNHGRLQLRSHEPSLREVLSRSRTATFFGINGGSCA